MSILRTAMPIGAMLLTLSLPRAIGAAPYIPRDGGQVLERLPARNDPVQKALAGLRAQLQREPANLSVATTLAQRYIELARNDADPRFLGYAQAALAPWWKQAKPPPGVLLLRAMILQSTHRFPQALADLDLLLRSEPSNSQAWLTRATVLQVRGEFLQAKKSCVRLYGIAPDLVMRTCLSNLASLSGGAKPAYLMLNTTLENSTGADPGVQVWSQTVLAEMAGRIGDAVAAETHFKRALALGASDPYLLGSYADFLLDQGRNSEVIALLKDKIRADGLVLRYALAQSASQAPSAAQSIAILRDRFEAATLRGDNVHLREQARFELQLMKHPKLALQLAQQNWKVQKEPADVRIFLEAAAAAKDRAAARPVLDWLKQTGLEDSALDRLKKSLEAPA